MDQLAEGYVSLPGLLANPVAFKNTAPPLLVFLLVFFFESCSESLVEELLLDPVPLTEELESLYRATVTNETMACLEVQHKH